MSFPDQLIAKKKTLKRKRRWNKKKTGRRRQPPHTQEQLSADRLSDWAYVKNLRREWEIVVYSPLPYPELQRDYRFNVKLAGSLIASPIGIKSSHGVTPKTRCSNFPSFHRSLLSELPEFLYGPTSMAAAAAQSGRTVESVWKKIIIHTVGQKIKKNSWNQINQFHKKIFFTKFHFLQFQK